MDWKINGLRAADKARFDEIYAIMKQSFPAAELRNFEKQYALLLDKRYSLKYVADESGVLSFLTGWDLGGFMFFEHFATRPDIRGQGVGKHLFTSALKQLEKPLVIEVETPDDEMKQRRLDYYLRMGFKTSEIYYNQPPLQPADSTHRLVLLTYPDTVEKQNLLVCRDKIFSTLYQGFSPENT